MPQEGNTQLTFIFTADSGDVSEGERLFESHARWMEQSHHRKGDLALLRYNVAEGAEVSNPLDPASDPTGRTSFVLTEVYETPAGLEDHWKQGQDGWEDFGAFMEWAGRTDVSVLHGSPVTHSLW